MRPYLKLQVLSQEEIAKIHSAMVSILSRTGLAVEHPDIREAFSECGAETDGQSGRVLFPGRVIDRFLGETRRIEYSSVGPSVSGDAGVYQGMYLEPGTSQIVPFTDQTLAGYVKLACLLEGVTDIGMQNYPTAGGRPTEPLELRIFAWKHGARESGSIQLTELCPYLLEMYQIRADAVRKPLSEVFRGFLFLVVSPLRIPEHEADQLMYFHKRGLRVRFGNMITAGGSGPVTLAGCLALNLAERIALGILERVLYGDRQWSLDSSIAPLDLRTFIQPYGRPEMVLANLATMQLAQYYGVRGSGHCGLTDAKLPSNEAGVQKLLSALPCILAGGGGIEPGLLCIDELHSPIQMILDAELVGALRRLVRGFDVDEETLAVNLIDEVGPGGLFTATEHTVKHFRTEQWQPGIWSREMLQTWLSGERKMDAQRALDVWNDLMSRPDPEPGITQETETQLWDVVRRAGKSV